MRVPVELAEAFGTPFQTLLRDHCVTRGLLPDPESLMSRRFLARSILPHVEKLSGTFNRRDPETGKAPKVPAGVDPYWKNSSNPENLRLAYFLAFMPCNLFRVSAIWAELSRLGFRWERTGLSSREFRAIELGAGPASGACGIAAGEAHAPVGLPSQGKWALLEQDSAILRMGAEWTETYFPHLGLPQWTTDTFHRKLDFNRALLPRTAPTFDLWLMSYVLNESEVGPEIWADRLIESWDRHLAEGGIAILCEPALKIQSRRLLELRKILLERAAQRKGPAWLKILTPCLGHQACGALAQAEDWCHEEVVWWRPEYLREIDKMAGLDRKSLPFSYLVVTKSTKSVEELLPALPKKSEPRVRLVSPAHAQGRDLEFFTCGTDGKRRSRYRPAEGQEIQRGSILTQVESRGEPQATRIDRVDQVL